jgi:hypothetical protein
MVTDYTRTRQALDDLDAANARLGRCSEDRLLAAEIAAYDLARRAVIEALAADEGRESPDGLGWLSGCYDPAEIREIVEAWM